MARSELFALLACCACTFGGGPGITPIRTSFNRGVYHQSRGDLDAAIAEYRLALEEDGHDDRARFNLALSLESKADLADSSMGVKYRQEAEREYRMILQWRAGELRASVNLAAMEWARGEGESAEARLRAATERYPDIALPWTALAAHLFRDGDIQGASVAVDAALARDPSSVWANVVSGELLAHKGEVDGARSAFRRALARDDEDLGALMALARLELQAGDPPAAVAAAERLFYVDPNHWEAQLLLSRAQEAAGNLERAVVHLWAARDLDHQRLPSTDPPDYRGRVRDLLTKILNRDR